jgi:two-component system sensor histidine kinase RstB
LYFQAISAILAATLLTVVLARLWLDTNIDVGSLKLLGGHAQLLAQTVANTPPSERREQAKQLSRVLGYRVELEEGVGPPEPRVEWRSGRIFVIAGVPQTPGQVVLGPVPYGRIAGLPTVTLLSFVIAVVVAWVALRGLFRRIRLLESVSAKMCAGEFSARVATEPGEALEGVGVSLNQLADRIGQLLSDERDLLRTVAHEVRAPISRMRFRVEKIHRRADDSGKKDSSGLISDLEQVDSLFEELLTYVAFDEFDYERPELSTTSIEVTAAVRRVVEEVTATAQDICVELIGKQDVKVVANRKLFDRAVTNLLLNAMAYGGPKITIYVREFDEESVVDVQDSGPGIPELDRPKVVKPFVRLAKKKTRGTGLGLAIVSRIMALHQGRLHLLDAPGGGASVQLVWKNAKQQPRKFWTRKG